MKQGSYDSYVRHFRMLMVWLQDNNYPTALGLIMPNWLIEAFEDLDAAGYCYSTPNTIRSAVALAVRLQGLSPPFVTDNPCVKAALQGYKRKAANRSVRRQPILGIMLAPLLKVVLDMVPTSLQDAVEAILRLGYAALFRISESRGVLMQHLTFLVGGLLLFLPTSKTDPLCRGVSVKIMTDLRLRELLLRLHRPGDPQAPLLRVHPAYINVLIRQAATTLGWQGYYSYHSLRHGRATDLWVATHDMQALMVAGRWRTRGAARYYVHQIVT